MLFIKVCLYMCACVQLMREVMIKDAVLHPESIQCNCISGIMTGR